MLILFFNVCARGLFVWLLCRSVKELEDEEDWKGIRRREEGAGGRRGVYKRGTCLAWWCRIRAACSCTSCHRPLAFHSFTYQLLIQTSGPRWVPPMLLFGDYFSPREREERQKIRLQNTKSKINDGDGCAGAEGKEINPAPRSLCPHSWVQMRLWPWVRFGRTLCSGYWIAVTAPLRCIPLSSAGMLSVSYPGFWTMKNSGKFWSKIPSMPIEIMYWMRSRTAKKSSLEQPHSSFQ